VESPDIPGWFNLKSGHESETNPAGHRVRQGALVQFSASLMDIEFEKPHLASVLKHRVQFSFQMSTRCPIGHESENLGTSALMWRLGHGAPYRGIIVSSRLGPMMMDLTKC
jgi:hypothetical protein